MGSNVGNQKKPIMGFNVIGFNVMELNVIGLKETSWGFGKLDLVKIGGIESPLFKFSTYKIAFQNEPSRLPNAF